MLYHRVHLDFVLDPDFLRIDPKLRGHWFALLAFCASRENGGAIEGAANFTRSDWSRVAGVTQSSCGRLCDLGLARWDGDRLVVIGYDMAGQDRAQACVRAGAKGAKLRWSRHSNPNGHAIDPPNGIDSNNAINNPTGDPNGGVDAEQSKSRVEQELNKRSEKVPGPDLAEPEKVNPAKRARDPIVIAPQAALLSQLLADYVMENHPSGTLAKTPPRRAETRLAKWSNTIRLMRTRDRHSWGEIQAMIDWSQRHPFWSTNVLGADSLRRHWDKMTAQKTGSQSGKQGGTAGPPTGPFCPPTNDKYQEGEVDLMTGLTSPGAMASGVEK